MKGSTTFVGSGTTSLPFSGIVATVRLVNVSIAYTVAEARRAPANKKPGRSRASAGLS